MKAKESYEELFSEIYKYVLACVGNISEAERITRNIFLSTLNDLRTANSSKTKTHIKTFLYKIARNQVNDYLKSNPSSNKKEGNIDTIRMLEFLNDDQRDILLLKICGRLSLEEISKVTGQEIDHIKTGQTEALRRLCGVLT